MLILSYWERFRVLSVAKPEILDDAQINDISSGAEQSEEGYYPTDLFDKLDELGRRGNFPPGFLDKGENIGG